MRLSLNALLKVLALVLLASLQTPSLAAEITGKVKSISIDTNAFVLTDREGKDWTIHLAQLTKIHIGKEGKLSDLKPGDEIAVTYEKKGDRLAASEIRLHSTGGYRALKKKGDSSRPHYKDDKGPPHPPLLLQEMARVLPRNTRKGLTTGQRKHANRRPMP